MNPSQNAMNLTPPHPASIPTATPAAEWPIDAALVRALLRAQHPDLADLAIEPFASGWDNAMFTLGADLLVRLPRRQIAAALMANEQQCLPALAPRLPVPIPAPVRTGRSCPEFPWPWSVVPKLRGVTADELCLEAGEADVLANFLRALHQPSPSDAPRNPVRGVPLAERQSVIEQRFTRLEQKTSSITRELRAAWAAGLAAPAAFANTWLHGDLHARNVLVHERKLSAVIDWGDVCQGDCATDLASVWMLLPDRSSRERAMTKYGGSGALWSRARAWAVSFGTVLLDTGLEDNPRHAVMGERTLGAIREGP